MSVLIGLLVVLAIIMAAGFVLPDHKVVTRTAQIKAPKEKIFGLIGDFRAWDAWSPWAGIDEDMKMEITGQGLGQVMAWSSENPKAGTGRQEIIEYVPNDRLRTKLNFGDMGGGEALFQLEEKGGLTEVSWSLETKMRDGVPLMRQPMATMFGFFIDKMVGADYEKGLAALKKVAEG